MIQEENDYRESICTRGENFEETSVKETEIKLGNNFDTDEKKKSNDSDSDDSDSDYKSSDKEIPIIEKIDAEDKEKNLSKMKSSHEEKKQPDSDKKKKDLKEDKKDDKKPKGKKEKSSSSSSSNKYSSDPDSSSDESDNKLISFVDHSVFENLIFQTLDNDEALDKLKDNPLPLAESLEDGDKMKVIPVSTKQQNGKYFS